MVVKFIVDYVVILYYNGTNKSNNTTNILSRLPCVVNNKFLKCGNGMKNSDIREAAKAAGVKLWQIADKLGITDGNFSRKLRKELSTDDKQKILTIIDDLSKGAA